MGNRYPSRLQYHRLEWTLAISPYEIVTQKRGIMGKPKKPREVFFIGVSYTEEDSACNVCLDDLSSINLVDRGFICSNIIGHCLIEISSIANALTEASSDGNKSNYVEAQMEYIKEGLEKTLPIIDLQKERAS